MISASDLEDLVTAYVDGSDADRERIRSEIRAQNLLSEVPIVDRFRNDPSPTTFRACLILYSMLDGFPDPRDSVLGLQDLFELARAASFDANELRREIAMLSSAEDRYGLCGSMRFLLMPNE